MKEKTTVLRGDTRRYKGNGRSLGYPTANINTEIDLADGVYFGFASLGPYRRHPALIFIGTPTTLGDKDRRVEAYLLDIPDKNYYGLELTISVLKLHRKNITFDTVDELLVAIKEDEKAGRRWFKQHSD